MIMDLVFAAGGAFVLGVFLNALLKYRSVRSRFLLCRDIPCTGGLAIGASFLASAVFFFFRQPAAGFPSGPLCLIAVAVLLFGLLDDLKNLSIGIKFGFQAIVSALLIGLGVKTQIAALNGALNIVLTMVWLMWIFNAFNLLDVLDGLAAGTALLAALSFFAVSSPGDTASLGLSLTLAAATASFLIFNYPPAKIYMGNSGSYFLGFVFGVVSLHISYAGFGHAVALATPGIILGFLIFDTLFLVGARLWRKKKPFRKSDDHLCLRFLSLGYPKKKILFLLWGLCLFFAAGGIIINRAGNAWGLGVLALVFVISFAVARKAITAKIYD